MTLKKGKYNHETTKGSGRRESLRGGQGRNRRAIGQAKGGAEWQDSLVQCLLDGEELVQLGVLCLQGFVHLFFGSGEPCGRDLFFSSRTKSFR